MKTLKTKTGKCNCLTGYPWNCLQSVLQQSSLIGCQKLDWGNFQNEKQHLSFFFGINKEIQKLLYQCGKEELHVVCAVCTNFFMENVYQGVQSRYRLHTYWLSETVKRKIGTITASLYIFAEESKRRHYHWKQEKISSLICKWNGWAHKWFVSCFCGWTDQPEAYCTYIISMHVQQKLQRFYVPSIWEGK